MNMTTHTHTFASVDQYIAAQPAGARDALERVRGAIRKALPRATETISYNMPTYKLGDVAVLQFAAWKGHYALYASTKPLVAAFKDELRDCTIEKGTIRFSLAQPVPERLIGRIATFRALHVH